MLEQHGQTEIPIIMHMPPAVSDSACMPETTCIYVYVKAAAAYTGACMLLVLICSIIVGSVPCNNVVKSEVVVKDSDMLQCLGKLMAHVVSHA